MTRNIHDIEREIDHIKYEEYTKLNLEVNNDTFIVLESRNGQDLKLQALNSSNEEEYQEIIQEIRNIIKSYAEADSNSEEE